jgi:peptidoglycan/LPS O-acetylase OafA/YrhL
MTDFSFLKDLFTNYETTKLHIANPFLLNSLIYSTLLLVTLVTLKKKPSTLLDFSQTEQLRGLSMLFVIIGHFWYHVCNENSPFLVFGDYAVTLFLLLSGFGLMSSNMTRQVTAREFFLKRIRKIFIPYWLVTVGIIIADYILLQKSYHVHELLITSAGINISKTLHYFDYARWFITLLLISYLAFFCCAKLWKPLYATLALMLFSLILVLLRHYELFPLGARHQLIAFPLGCLIAVLGPSKWWNKIGIRHQMAIIMFIALAMVSIYLAGLNHKDSYSLEKALVYLQSYILPYLFCALCILSISIVASTGYTSKFLSLCGCLSYELYLIHGPLLIKYNPIVGNFENRFMLIGVLLWLGIGLGLAYALKVSTTINYRRGQKTC